MYCTNCGKKIDEDSHFCTYCGKKVTQLSTTVVVVEGQEIEPSTAFPTLASQEPEAVLQEPKIRIKKKVNKYDETYQRDFSPTVLGCLLVLISVAIYVTSINFKTAPYPDYQQMQRMQEWLGFVNIALRIMVTIWVCNIARFRNRNEIAWGFLAFFLPAFALILIGLMKKLKTKLKN